MPAGETTPSPQPSAERRGRSYSRPTSRPTTPLRRSSRGSITTKRNEEAFPLNSLEPAFAELADSMSILDANFLELQQMHDSLTRFNETFSAFLYGLNMNAFCVDFPEAPLPESFKRTQEKEERAVRSAGPIHREYDVETTFMTNDTSFVNEPPPPSVKQPTPTPPQQPLKTPARRVPVRGTGNRGGRGRGASGIARGRGISYR